MNLVRFETLLGLALVSVGARAAFRTWANPASLLAGVFFLALGWQQVAIPDVSFGPLAATAILAGSVALLIGAVLAKGPARRPLDMVIVIAPGRLRICDVAVWIVAAAAAAYTWIAYDTVIVQQNSYVNGVFYRETFFAGEGASPLYRGAQALMYVGAVLIALDVLARGFRRLPPVIFLGSLAAQSVILSTKASLLIALTLMSTVWVAARQASLRRAVSRTNMAVVVAALLGSIAVSSAVTVRRAGSDADPVAAISYSVAGPASAFSHVLDGGFDPGGQGGLWTVGGLVDVLGRQHRSFGAGFVPVELTPNVYDSRINVYTWYLSLLRDVGPLAMVAVLAALGYWSTALQRRSAGGRAQVPGLVVFALLLSLLAWAPILPLTYFNFWFLILVLAPLFALLYRTAQPREEPADPRGPRAISRV